MSLWDNPTVRHRLQVGGYAKITGNISLAAREFSHDRKTVRRYLRLYEEFERSGDLRCFLNRARGDNHRTPNWIEDKVVAYYQEEDTTRTCPNIANALAQEGISITRQTVYNILKRRGVYVKPGNQKDPIRSTEEEVPNACWQIDLIEQEDSKLGKVYALVVIDDHSRYLVGLRFFLSKALEPILYELYQIFLRHGLPARVVVDRGRQFYSEVGKDSRFREILSRLGIEVVYTSNPHGKGKVDIQRDFLGVYRHKVDSLEDMNIKAEGWRHWYNKREHEGISTTPSGRYSPSPHRVAKEALWEVFASEQRRKVYRDATISLWGCRYKVPPEYIGQYVWLRIFAGLVKVCVGVDNKVITSFKLHD